MGRVTGVSFPKASLARLRNGARLHELPFGDGDIVLMHDMSDSSVRAALHLVDDLQAKGFRFVTVSELSALRGQSLEPGAVYGNFRR